MAASPHTQSTLHTLPAWLRGLLWLTVLAVLLGVFALYTRPEFMLTLADQVWACF